MKTLKLIAIALTAAAVAGPAFAGRDEALIAVMERARINAQKDAQKGVAGPVGVQGKVGPATSRPTVNIGHPSERVRR